MLRAIIFDFDGVIVDSEPLIMKLTQQMAAQQGWSLSAEEYYRDYLALDDRGIVEQLFHSHRMPFDAARRDALVAWKARAYQKAIYDGLPPMPGAVNFVCECAKQYPLAIASGSLREEVEPLLAKLELREKFCVLATADDCQRSKPDPEVYLAALSKLRETAALSKNGVVPAECLAIEDAPAGVNAAHAAGMKCVALSFSRPAAELQHADRVFSSFAEVDLEEIRRLF